MNLSAFFVIKVLLKLFFLWFTWRVVSWLVVQEKWARKFRGVPSAPGLRSYPVIGLLFSFFKLVRCAPKNIPMNAYFLQVAYGIGYLCRDVPVFRFDLGWIKQVVVVTSKEGAEAILGNPDEQKKSDEYKFFTELVGMGIFAGPYQKWKKHRRIWSPTFNPRVLDSFQPIMYEHSDKLVNKIKSKIGKETIYFESLMTQCSMAIVTETGLGFKVDRDLEEEVPFLTAFQKVTALMGRRILSPWLWPNILFRFSPTGKELKKNFLILYSTVREALLKSKEEIMKDPDGNLTQNKCRSFLEQLLLHNLRCKPEDLLTEQEIQDETNTFCFAGVDTLSVTTDWAVYMLGLHPEVMVKAAEEINDIFNGDRNQPITVDHLKKMDYLDRIIKESQRLFPVAPTLLRILRQDTKIGNVTIPKGTTVAVGVSGLHFDPVAFSDPVLFNPDRFLDTNVSTYQLLPFSAGPRSCIGQRYALLEVKTILANLIRHFDWTSLDTRDIVLRNPDVASRPHIPLRIEFKQRF